MRRNTKDYLIRFSPDTYEDLQNLKKLDNRTTSSLIHEGVRLLLKDKIEHRMTLRKNRESISGMI